MTWTPSDIDDGPEDDPVIAAIARANGTAFEFADGKDDFRRNINESDRIATREIIAMRASTPMGKDGGYALVVFGRDGSVFYRRHEGRFEITIDDDLLPRTVVTGSQGAEIGRIVDVPGIGHWPIASVIHNEIDGDIRFHLTPTAPEEAP